MKRYNVILLLITLFLFFSCAKKTTELSLIKEKNLELQVLEAYEEGKKFLETGDSLYAAKKFNEAEMLFPQSVSAPKSAIMAAYSYYVQDYYGDAISELLRFKKIYPKYKDIDYVNYLLAICYYEQIVDEKKDLQPIIKAKKQFNYIIKEFPDSEFALDAEFKIDLINNLLASKEMYVGRYYLDKKKWIPAINRFRVVVDEYDTTIYVEEALHRLVEVYYTIGLKSEAKKYANLLGYNYKSSRWYEMSYSVFNEKYEKEKIKIKKNKSSILNKAKSLFDLDE